MNTNENPLLELQEELQNQIAAAFPELATNLSNEAYQKLAQFTQSLIEFGKLYGLTGLSEPQDIIRELIVDSLAMAQFLKPQDRLADLGSGGGIPGIPLAIVCPDCQIVMLESQNRKVKWINEQIEALALSHNAQALAVRLEDAGRDPSLRATFDYVTAKALAALPSLIELSIPLLKLKGELMAYKGIKLEEELVSSANAIEKLKCQWSQNLQYTLGDRTRYLCRIAKTQPTPNAYPRKMGMPQHKPL